MAAAKIENNHYEPTLTHPALVRQPRQTVTQTPGTQTHWLYEEHPAFWTKVGTYPSQRFIEAISKYLYHEFCKAIPEFSSSDYQRRITHFFFFVCGRTPMSRGQILHAAIILARLIKQEAEDIANLKAIRASRAKDEGAESSTDSTTDFEPVVTEGNLGTLLLCSLAIAGKINEDVPFNNKYWANLLQIDVRIVNSSESVFLQRLRYDVSFHDEQVYQLAQSLNLV